jgi:GNAT superfamily N-acetyltransferase
VQVVAAQDVRRFFEPERPGPVIHGHIESTGVGRCRVDAWPDPRTVVAELPGGNIALRGTPRVIDDLAGLVEAPVEWLPALTEVDPGTATWPRVIATLPPGTELPAPGPAVRPLTAADGRALAGLDPSIAWIGETWGGLAGLAGSGHAWAAFDDGVPVSVACGFFLGRRYIDIGVVTEPESRGRGLSTSCAAAVAADIRASGRQPSWTTTPDNAGSLGVAARLGFVHQRDDVLYAVSTPVPTTD